MMYRIVVMLTMLVLPLCSIVLEHFVRGGAWIMLVGKWFVFWAVGIRLFLAGLRQYIQPAFTAREIFNLTSDDALPLVRELGMANSAMGVVGIVSIANSAFILPVSIASGIFYGAAGFQHVFTGGRSSNENIAMLSDIFAFIILAIIVIAALR